MLSPNLQPCVARHWGRRFWLLLEEKALIYWMHERPSDGCFVRMKALLVQARDADDPVLLQEQWCFSEYSGIAPADLICVNALDGIPFPLQEVAVVFIGGSGKYSATQDLPWTEPVLQLIWDAHRMGMPVFGSCWGFHMIVKAYGGTVRTDENAVELGTLPVALTEEGRRDELFQFLPPLFPAQLGHKDHVPELPPGFIHLACSEMYQHQAFRMAGTAIYATQFHPEMNAEDIRYRLQNYLDCGYVTEEERLSAERILASFRETPECCSILRRFVDHFCR